MRAFLAAILAAAAIGCCTPASAAPVGNSPRPNATPLIHLAQVSRWGGYYYGGSRPACPWHYHFYCRYMPYYGNRQCACWPD